MNKRQIIVWIVGLLMTFFIVMAGAFINKSFKEKKESTFSNDKKVEQTIRTVAVNQFPPNTIKSSIDVDGRLNAFEKINLAAEVQGKLMDTGKVIKEGTSFSEGELLFQIESKDDEYNLKAQRSTLFNLITQIMSDLKFDYPSEFQKWQTYLDNFDVEKNVNPLPEITNKNEKYFIGGKNILTQYFTIKGLEEKMKNYNIYAPFNGVFLSINAFPGALVSPGVALGQIMNSYHYELVSPISMEDMKYVSVGQKVELKSEEMGKSWKGTVNRTSKQIDQSTQSIPVFITVTGSGLRDGMYLKGTLGGNTISNVSVLPKDVVVNQNAVFIYKDSSLTLKSLQVIKSVEGNVYARGLEASDNVVISSQNNLYDGQKVKL